MMISGEVKSDCTDFGVGDGLDATDCKMSPIWQVTAVHGKAPMKVPLTQSMTETPQTPQAMLMPDQGMIPMSRRMERRTQGEDFATEVASVISESEFPSIALRVIVSARGNTLLRNGANGADRRLANTEPIVVRAVRSRVA